MACQIAHHLATTGRMTNVNGVLEVKMRRQCREVVGVVIHVMAFGRLGGSSVAAAVMCDHAITVIEKEQMGIPIIR